MQSNWEEIHQVARQWSKTHCQLNKGLHQEEKVEAFRLAKLISRFPEGKTNNNSKQQRRVL